jgi:hypothetical protein
MMRPTYERMAAAAFGAWLAFPAMSAGAQSLGQPGRPSLVITDGAESGVRSDKDKAVAQRDVAPPANAKPEKVVPRNAVATPHLPVTSAAEKRVNQSEAGRGQ